MYWCVSTSKCHRDNYNKRGEMRSIWWQRTGAVWPEPCVTVLHWYIDTCVECGVYTRYWSLVSLAGAQSQESHWPSQISLPQPTSRQKRPLLHGFSSQLWHLNWIVCVVVSRLDYLWCRYFMRNGIAVRSFIFYWGQGMRNIVISRAEGDWERNIMN